MTDLRPRATATAVAAAPEPAPAARLAALAAVVGAGLIVSVQVFLNGRLAQELGSAELAGSVNHVGGLITLIVIGVASGVPGRARRRLAGAPTPRWWMVLAGVNGGLFIIVAAYAAPRIGVALLTVAFVAGQTTGSLLVDRLGLSPAGRKLFTLFRVSGVAVALVAVLLGAANSHGDPQIGILVLAMAVGAGVAVQQAALGHIARATGEPLAAGALNFATGAVLTVGAALIATGGSAPDGWSAPPADWIVGILGATVVVILAASVPILGVLGTMLAMVAGQSVGGLVIDLVAAPPGEAVTALTVVSVALTVAAVFISGISRGPAPPPAVVSGD